MYVVSSWNEVNLSLNCPKNMVRIKGNVFKLLQDNGKILGYVSKVGSLTSGVQCLWSIVKGDP